MSNYKIKSIFFGVFLLTQLIYGQNFVDDLYYNDTEVNYDFLYTDDNISTEETPNDSISNDYRWDDDISYENRMRKFNNSYYLDYYWDYGWHSPTWYNWHQPSWGWSLNYHNYGWGLGLHYGSSWHSPYNYWNYGWHSPWHYGHHHWNNYHYSGLNNYVISTSYQNVSYGHRASRNTNVNHNTNTQQRSRMNLTQEQPKPSQNIEKPDSRPANNIVEKLKNRVSPQKKYTQNNRGDSYNANKNQKNSNNNNSYKPNNRNEKVNSNRSNRPSRSQSNRSSRSNSNRGKRN